jgi:hypothetical protein
MITTIALACWEVLRGSDCPYVPRSKVRSTPRLTRSKVGEVKGRPQGRRSTPRSKVDPRGRILAASPRPDAGSIRRRRSRRQYAAAAAVVGSILDRRPVQAEKVVVPLLLPCRWLSPFVDTKVECTP